MPAFYPQRPRPQPDSAPRDHVWFGLLLAVFLLIAQCGALWHGAEHGIEPHTPDEPACQLCLDYTAVGAGAAASPLLLLPPPQAQDFIAAPAHSHPVLFRPAYRSRAPPV